MFLARIFRENEKVYESVKFVLYSRFSTSSRNLAQSVADLWVREGYDESFVS